MAGPGGPLAAFGHMQRALREADFRTASLEQAMTTEQSKHERAVESLTAENRTLRQQLSDLPDVLIDGVLERHVSATGLAALPVSGASMSSVRPTSLIRSAKRRHSFTFTSKPEPTTYEKSSEPNMLKPSRSTHTSAAAIGLAS